MTLKQKAQGTDLPEGVIKTQDVMTDLSNKYAVSFEVECESGKTH